MVNLLSLSRSTIIFDVVTSLLLSVALVFASVIRAAVGMVTAVFQIAGLETAQQSFFSDIGIVELLLIVVALSILAIGLATFFRWRHRFRH